MNGPGLTALVILPLAVCVSSCSPTAEQRMERMMTRMDAGSDLIGEVGLYLKETSEKLSRFEKNITGQLETMIASVQKEITSAESSLGSRISSLEKKKEVELAPNAKIEASSIKLYGDPSKGTHYLYQLIDGSYFKSTWEESETGCFHTQAGVEEPWIRFEFDHVWFIREIFIFNRLDTYSNRLFPFELLLIDDEGNERKCGGKRFEVGDKEILDENQNPIVINCDDLKPTKAVKLVGYHPDKMLNLCEVKIYGY